MNVESEAGGDSAFDYIIVGSGAGGGPLAARLALAGKRVLVIEAGSDHASLNPDDNAREVTEVPALHAVSTEHPDLSWQFFVQHYNEGPNQPVDSKADARGIFYPRAAALGGCTVHNAMITVAGPDSDWDDLADFLQDDSWRAETMRPYFQQLERNEYVERTDPPSTRWGHVWANLRWLFGFEPDHTNGRHGFDGWLRTSVADIAIGVRDRQLVKMLKAALKQAQHTGIDRIFTFVGHFLHGRIKETLDPNHARTQADSPEGLALIPLAVCGKNGPPDQNGNPSSSVRGHRSSPREFLLEVQASHPDNLFIWTDCFVTEVLFDGSAKPRAVGVNYLQGKGLYRAHPEPAPYPPQPFPVQAVRVRNGGEVILSGGAFNTPQILMISGLGDRDHLQSHGINCRAHLPGVGRNLHDRYEVTVISEMERDFSLLDGIDFKLPDTGAEPDAALREWLKDGSGLYASNGSVLGILKRSRPELAQPDLFIFGLPLAFKGYAVGYSKDPKHNFFTWAILKAHTRNRDGTVLLRSRDPFQTPEINFHYFQEETLGRWDDQDEDLLALVEGVKFVRGIAKRAHSVVKREDHPGVEIVPEGDDAMLKEWIRREAWGHHACGSCRMGPLQDENAVLDSRFRVRGVEGLRVVDASIFPKIPGYFIVTNIYVASEKAADVILEDAGSDEARNASADNQAYPRVLHAREAAAIRRRREEVTSEPAQSQAAEPMRNETDEWSSDVTGLALSGGGIRSATFNLGILQTLARSHCLRRFDFLSTVSGGTYIGSFLGRFYDRLRHDPLARGGRVSVQPPCDRVEHELVAADSREIGWLRKHGNYIAPAGRGDSRFNLAVLLRNLLSVHFVVGVLVFALFALANTVRYGLFDKIIALQGLVMDRSAFPLGYLLEQGLGVFWSPWFVLFELVLLLFVVPGLVGYWMASQDEHERYHWPTLFLVFTFLALLFFLGLHGGVSWPPIVMGLSLMLSFLAVELAWRRGRVRQAAVGTGGPETQNLRTRNYLTHDLGFALALAGMALAFAIIDTIGHGLQQLAAANQNYAKAFAQMGAALAALIPIARMAANFLAGEKKPSGPPSTLKRIFKKQLMAGLLALVLGAAPLIFYSFAAHAVFQGGAAVKIGTAAMVFAFVLSLILARPAALTFVNRSSLSQTYASRLARSFLGASNPLRHRPQGANITEVMAEDDVSSIRDYRPHEAGGPFHLINVTVNQTVDFTSQRGNRDRKGESMALSSLGLSIGKRWHSLWEDRLPQRCDRRNGARAVPAGWPAGTDHPLVDENGGPSECAEALSLRQWMGISGAAVSPGRGQNTELGTALLFGLANLRTGYWWDSGVTETARDGFPKLTFLRRLLYLVPRVFLTQALLVFECIARYPGPWERFWYLSDGGFFENLGAYELIRRRVPRIVVCDAGADPTYQFDDLANMIRKVRIDFGARVESFTEADIKGVGSLVPAAVGTFDELKPVVDAEGRVISSSPKHGALFWVHYENQPKKRSVLLYLKAKLTEDETPDVRHYYDTHREFPHESTGDQFFDEAQWESYRQLGQHIASDLFDDPAWFWQIPLK